LKIKTKKYYECVYNGEEVDKQWLYLTDKYSEEGELLERISYHENGEAAETVVHEYADGKLIKTARTDHAFDLTTTTKFEYDGDKIKKQTDFYNENDFIETRYTYNEKGQLLEALKIDNEDITQGKIMYSYNEAEHGVTESRYADDGTLAFEIERYQDEKGNEIDILERQYFGKEFNEVAHEKIYNDNNKVIDGKVFDKDDKLVFHVENIYDDNGDLQKQLINDHASQSKNENIFHKDDDNNQVREEFENGDLALRVTTKFDSNDNLIEEVSYRKKIDDYFEWSAKKFEIEYYG